MIVPALLLSCVVAASANTTDPGLATVRHFSRSPEPRWMFTVRESADGGVSATAWWIERETPSSPGPLFDARIVDVTLSDCPAVREIANSIQHLPVPRMASVPATDPRGPVFELETPENPVVDLGQLAPDHPLVRWATKSWEELSACARARR
jgi:hypothetical protein